MKLHMCTDYRSGTVTGLHKSTKIIKSLFSFNKVAKKSSEVGSTRVFELNYILFIMTQYILNIYDFTYIHLFLHMSHELCNKVCRPQFIHRQN
jgi:hypothetical protein